MVAEDQHMFLTGFLRFIHICLCVRCNSFMGNSAVQKKPISKPRKPHLSGHKSSSSSREPQPKRVEEVYGALKQGLEWVLLRCFLWFSFLLSHRSSLSALATVILNAHWPHESQWYGHCSCIILKSLSFSLSVSEYLEVHQTELDKLTSLMKDMKRNSRLVRLDMASSGCLHTTVYAASECCKSIDFNEQISWVVKSKAAERDINSPKTNQQLLKHCSIMNYSQCKCWLLI